MRRELESLMERPGEMVPTGVALLQARSDQVQPAMGRLLRLESDGRLGVGMEDLAASLLHMHANRMLRSDQRVQEMVLFDYLNRLYQGRLSRRGASITQREDV